MTKASDLAALGGIIATPVGTAPGYVCRAWVNFNGTTNVGGFCTVRASGNVTTVADNGTGDYTINFTTAMSDANYAVVGSVSWVSATASTAAFSVSPITLTTGSVRIVTGWSTGSATDATNANIAIFR